MDLPQPHLVACVRQLLKLATLTALVKALEIQYPNEPEPVFIRAARDEQWIEFYLEGKEPGQ